MDDNNMNTSILSFFIYCKRKLQKTDTGKITEFIFIKTKTTKHCTCHVPKYASMSIYLPMPSRPVEICEDNKTHILELGCVKNLMNNISIISVSLLSNFLTILSSLKLVIIIILIRLTVI